MLYGVFGPIVGGITFFYLTLFFTFFGIDQVAPIEAPQIEGMNFILSILFIIPFYLLLFPVTLPMSYAFGLIPSLLTGYALWFLFKNSQESLFVRLSWAVIVGILMSFFYAIMLILIDSSFADFDDIFTIGMSAFFYIPGTVSSITCFYFLKKHYSSQPNNQFYHGRS